MSNCKIICTGNYQLEGWKGISSNVDIIRNLSMEENMMYHVSKNCDITKIRESKYDVNDITPTGKIIPNYSSVHTINNPYNERGTPKYEFKRPSAQVLYEKTEEMYELYVYVESQTFDREKYFDAKRKEYGNYEKPNVCGYIKVLQFDITEN